MTIQACRWASEIIPYGRSWRSMSRCHHYRGMWRMRVVVLFVVFIKTYTACILLCTIFVNTFCFRHMGTTGKKADFFSAQASRTKFLEKVNSLCYLCRRIASDSATSSRTFDMCAICVMSSTSGVISSTSMQRCCEPDRTALTCSCIRASIGAE
jgi:hypothetical protein